VLLVIPDRLPTGVFEISETLSPLNLLLISTDPLLPADNLPSVDCLLIVSTVLAKSPLDFSKDKALSA